jgi:hypothetical protein
MIVVGKSIFGQEFSHAIIYPKEQGNIETVGFSRTCQDRIDLAYGDIVSRARLI